KSHFVFDRLNTLRDYLFNAGTHRPSTALVKTPASKGVAKCPPGPARDRPAQADREFFDIETEPRKSPAGERGENDFTGSPSCEGLTGNQQMDPKMNNTIELEGWRGRLDAGLPARQLEALLYACADMTMKQIAKHMGISPDTAKDR